MSEYNRRGLESNPIDDDEPRGNQKPVATADAPDDGKLSRFQWELLYVLAAKPGCTDHGLGIKETLDGYYQDPVNHGRLYPNLDTLVQQDLIDKGEVDGRTHSFTLNADGKRLVRQDAQRRYGLADQIGGAE